MDTIFSADTLRFFLIFGVPGIVAVYVRAQFLTGRLPPIAEGVVAYVTLSLIYHAIAYPISHPLYADTEITGWKAVAWFILLFIAPASLGLLLGLNIRFGWMKRLLNKVRLNTVHPVESAWDWRFGNCPECWVLVILKDGTKWAGYAGQNSFMSSNPTERDIFIEQVFEVNEDGTPWTARTSSVWIAHGEIQSLEFWPK